MLGSKYERHSLEQLNFIQQLVKRPTLELREALYLATQLVNHGFTDAQHFIEQLQKNFPSKSVRSYLTRLKKRNIAIQSIPLLKKFRDDPEIVQEFYKTEGITFRVGTHRRSIAIVIFTTKFNNFTFSNLVMDAMLSELGVSRLFLRDTSEYLYLRGIRGLADSLSDLPEVLCRVLQENEIQSVILTGYSSGGYPSLFVATKMNHIGYTGFSISTDVSLQSSIPRTLIYEKIRNQVNQSLLTNLKPAIMSGNTSRYSIYYGQRDPLDRAQAQHLQDIRGLKLIPLRDAGHELTAYLLEEGRFMETLTYHLGI